MTVTKEALRFYPDKRFYFSDLEAKVMQNIVYQYPSVEPYIHWKTNHSMFVTEEGLDYIKRIINIYWKDIQGLPSS
jgi:hypothetical protein